MSIILFIFNSCFRAALQAVQDVWCVRPLVVREGGTMPVIRFLQDTLRVPAIHLPIGQASDAAHMPNERIRIVNLKKVTIKFKIYHKSSLLGNGCIATILFESSSSIKNLLNLSFFFLFSLFSRPVLPNLFLSVFHVNLFILFFTAHFSCLRSFPVQLAAFSSSGIHY